MTEEQTNVPLNGAVGAPVAHETTDKNIFKAVNIFGRKNDSVPTTGSMLTRVDDIDYSMKHKRRGSCYIFNNYKFNIQHISFPERKGSKKDAEALDSVFQNLGFKVEIHENLQCSAIERMLKDIQKMNDDVDCLVVVVLTYNYEGLLVAKDTMYSMETIFSYFSGDKCPRLAGKPKIFIVQACDLEKRRYSGDKKGIDVADSAGQYKIPSWADFVLLHSTVPGHLEWNSGGEEKDTKGSFVIQRLADALKQYSSRLDLLTIFTLVNSETFTYYKQYYFDKKPLKRPPVYQRHTLTRRILFPNSLAQ